jgi:uncharacterized secreted repeat protein (TIGR03808 family)
MVPVASGGAHGRPSETRVPTAAVPQGIPASVFGLEADLTSDQSAKLQTAIDQTTVKGQTLLLPPGVIVAGNVLLRSGTRIAGAAGATTFVYSGAGFMFRGSAVRGVRLAGFVIDGQLRAFDYDKANALIVLDDAADVVIDDVVLTRSSANGIVFNRVSGVMRRSSVRGVVGAAVHSTDARGLEISANAISDCSDNGILVWRSAAGGDGTIVRDNRIQRIANKSGGTGEYGNGINIYRAGGVVVTGNVIEDCAYSAIRANAANNVQMIANSAVRSGEVALYAEFGFEGALIANNLIDGAATGIAVTNFNEGGRLAVVNGNIVRNLFRREHEKTDKRGEGIGVEADAVVTGNVIEGAPTAGLLIGWGSYMREVSATGNLIRKSRIGIAVTGHTSAGACLLANNMITGARDGAIRAMDHGRAVGGDLATGKAPGHISLNGNVTA